jgi:hypothetical protein
MRTSISQTELSALADLECLYNCAIKGLVDRIKDGEFVEDGPLQVDLGGVITTQPVVVPAMVQLAESPGNPIRAEPIDLLERELHRLSPMTTLLRSRDFEFLRQHGVNARLVRRVKQARIEAYFWYLGQLELLVARLLRRWAKCIGHEYWTFERLDRARWKFRGISLALRWYGIQFALHLPVRETAVRDRLEEVRAILQPSGA